MDSTLFGTAKLVRLLDAWAPAEIEPASGDVAERMSHWFGPLDAIRLQAAEQSLRSADDGPSPCATPRQVQAVADDIQRVRGVLAKAIAQDPLALAGLKPGDPDAAGYAPFQQRHIELQRQMGQMAGALRDHVRHAVSAASPRLAPLATLDAAFESLLAAREQALWPTTGALLQRRHAQLRAGHAQALQAEGRDDDPLQWRQPGGWLAAFAHDWREALLAELDLRLEPVMGLLEALRTPPGPPEHP